MLVALQAMLKLLQSSQFDKKSQKFASLLLSSISLQFTGDMIVAAQFDINQFKKLVPESILRQAELHPDHNLVYKQTFQAPNQYADRMSEKLNSMVNTAKKSSGKTVSPRSKRFMEAADDMSQIYGNSLNSGHDHAYEAWSSASSVDSDDIRYFDGAISSDESTSRGRKQKRIVTGNVKPGGVSVGKKKKKAANGRTNSSSRGRSSSNKPSKNKGAGARRKVSPNARNTSSSPGRRRGDSLESARSNTSPGRFKARSTDLTQGSIESLREQVEDVLSKFQGELNYLKGELGVKPSQLKTLESDSLFESSIAADSAIDKQIFNRPVISRGDSRVFRNKGGEASYYRSKFATAMREIDSLNDIVAQQYNQRRQDKRILLSLDQSSKNFQRELEEMKRNQQVEIENKVNEAKQQLMAEIENMRYYAPRGGRMPGRGRGRGRMPGRGPYGDGYSPPGEPAPGDANDPNNLNGSYYGYSDGGDNYGAGGYNYGENGYMEASAAGNLSRGNSCMDPAAVGGPSRTNSFGSVNGPGGSYYSGPQYGYYPYPGPGRGGRGRGRGPMRQRTVSGHSADGSNRSLLDAADQTSKEVDRKDSVSSEISKLTDPSSNVSIHTTNAVAPDGSHLSSNNGSLTATAPGSQVLILCTVGFIND
jgi:hypothetical protein